MRKYAAERAERDRLYKNAVNKSVLIPRCTVIGNARLTGLENPTQGGSHELDAGTIRFIP